MDGVGNYGMFKGTNELVPNTGTELSPRKLAFTEKALLS